MTDRLRSYGAAMKEIGIENRQLRGGWLNNQAENSHQPFRRREGAMARFRDVKILQKFASAHASIHNHVNLDLHFILRATQREPLRRPGRVARISRLKNPCPETIGDWFA